MVTLPLLERTNQGTALEFADGGVLVLIRHLDLLLGATVLDVSIAQMLAS